MSRAEENPLSPLCHAHEQTLRQCEALSRLVFYLGQCEPDARSRRACQDLLAYFDNAEPQLHAHEEEYLFPALLESMAGSDAVCLREMASSLTREHRELEAKWARLRKQLQAVAAGMALPGIVTQAEDFIRLARHHVECEESEVVPMAARLIADSELARIGSALVARQPLGQGRAVL